MDLPERILLTLDASSQEAIEANNLGSGGIALLADEKRHLVGTGTGCHCYIASGQKPIVSAGTAIMDDVPGDVVTVGLPASIVSKVEEK